MAAPSRLRDGLGSAAADQRYDFDLVTRLKHAPRMGRSRHELLIPFNSQVAGQQLQFVEQFRHRTSRLNLPRLTVDGDFHLHCSR